MIKHLIRAGMLSVFLAMTAFVAFTPSAGASHFTPIPGCVNAQLEDSESVPTVNPNEDSSTSFFGFPYWYKYLEKQTAHDDISGALVCSAKLGGINDVWLIVAAVIELMLRVATLVAIGFMIFGGVTYMISQGAPDKTKQAQSTVINAAVGLIVSIVAAAIVSFIAGRFNS